MDSVNVPLEFGAWGGLQSMGNGCGLQMDGFSAHFEPSESIFDYFHDFGHFGLVSGGLMLFPEGPRTLRKVPGPSKSVSRPRDLLRCEGLGKASGWRGGGPHLWGLVATGGDWWRLLWPYGRSRGPIENRTEGMQVYRTAGLQDCRTAGLNGRSRTLDR